MHPARSILLGFLLACIASAADRPPRYVARLADGTRVEGDRLANWYDAGALPQLAGKPLLAPANPLRWLRDRHAPLANLPPAYVEFTNGDRLPGTVIDFRSGREDPYRPQPPHLVVRVALAFEPPDNRPVPEIRVAAEFVRRIVWQRHSAVPYRPGTAHYLDGRSLDFRAIRFQPGQVHLLLAEGGRRISWSELSELHLPAVDSWTAWFDHLVAVCPDAAARLIEIETSTGLIATASTSRLAARFEGNSSLPDRWVHGLQPAWSLDILWVPFRDIAYYRSYAAHEVPLSRIRPRSVARFGGLSSASVPQINRSTLGTPLASKALEFGWGVGVAGGTELTYDLPPGARLLRAEVCLDRLAADGGCVRPRIFADRSSGKPLWEGPVLAGSDSVADTGPIALAQAAGQPGAVTLQTDAVIHEKPTFADPLDIRDHADWCDLLLTLDTQAVQEQFDQRLNRRFTAWRDWQVQIDGGFSGDADLEVAFVRTSDVPGAFETLVRVNRLPLVLRREVALGPRDQWLWIAASSRPKNVPRDAKIEVRIDGQMAGLFTVPRRDDSTAGGKLASGSISASGDGQPIIVPLPKRRAAPTSLPIEIRQLPEPRSGGVEYRAIMIAEQLPTLYCIFEDDAQPLAVEQGQWGNATVVEDVRYSGRAALRLTPSGRFRIELPGLVRVRAAPQWGEMRFIRFAVKKQGGGRVAVELEDAQPRDQPARYDAGTGEPSYGRAQRASPEELSQGWVVITRDLYADFGNIDAKALIVGCPDGAAAWIDHVYLARTREDFRSPP